MINYIYFNTTSSKKEAEKIATYLVKNKIEHVLILLTIYIQYIDGKVKLKKMMNTY